MYCLWGWSRKQTPIWNPNVFPANDADGHDHIWVVCPGCKEWVEESMRFNFDMIKERVILRGDLNER